MTGARLQIDAPSLGTIQARLARLANPRLDKLMAAIGAEVESQTKLRIADEKTSPAGVPWASWSDSYAKTRRGGQRLLQGEGHLLDSIQYAVTAQGVEVGSNLIYGALHQFGGAGVGKPSFPARPYLGLSQRDAEDITKLIERHLKRLLGAPASSGSSSGSEGGGGGRSPGRDERGRFLPRGQS